MLTTSETLSADVGCGHPPNAERVPCGRPPKQKAVEGGEELLMRSGLTVGNIYLKSATV